MNIQRLWYILTIMSVLSLTFYLGSLYGRRERIDAQEDNIRVIGPNLSIQNSLTEMEIRTVLGSQDSQNIQTYGQLFFKVLPTNQTEILIQMENVPDIVTQSNQQVQQNIPNELQVATARRKSDGLDYEYTQIGKIIFNEPQNGLRSGRFSTTIEADLSDTERVVFQPPSGSPENVFIDTNPDLPTQVRSRPAPYFWVEI